jgi:hypothetical protein
MVFDTPISAAPDGALVGPARHPKQMLGDQQYDGHASLHDDDVAGGLGLAGAPIEGPTHFSQFDPLAFSAWGRRWFETGCISAHFLTRCPRPSMERRGSTRSRATVRRS